MNARTQDATTTTSAQAQAKGVPVSMDFANVSGGRLLVYGWVLGLSKQVARAEIHFGEMIVDLMDVGVSVSRSDVAKHFPALVGSDDDAHGFFLAVPLAHVDRRPTNLRLLVWPKSGEPSESSWPVSAGESAVVFFFQQHRTTLDSLLKSLRAADARWLRGLMPSSVGSGGPAVAQLAFGIDACHLLDGRTIVVSGWLNGGGQPLTAACISLGGASLDCLPDTKISTPTVKAGDVNLRGEARTSSTFTWAGVLPGDSTATEVTVEFATSLRSGSARHPISKNDHVNFAQSLNSLEAGLAIDLLERVSALAKAEDGGLATWLLDAYAQTIEGLPQSLETARRRVFLHCEGATFIAPHGIFLTGWFSADKGAVAQLACHNGTTGVRIDCNWVRRGRPDVASHLKSLGVADADDEYGFLCYVAFDQPAAAYYLAVTFRDGTVQRIRLPPVQSATSAIHAIRTVLTSFALPHRALRTLLDRQIGPAVQSAWTHRQKNTHPVASQRFGLAPSRSAVSVIVPLYGRSDLAEYQMALFADDPDFQTADLIYFVDDPAIYDAFQALCPDLYGIYQVPFTLVFAGANLGFAGANNRAAAMARGEHLILMNSDVLPKTRGWLSEMLTQYGALDKPGLLGVKLLYEDGSVQHAGMNFRRHAAWADMWINEHPHKGQNAQGLTGVRQVDSVTAACAMVSASLYRELGGLSEDYIIGDFEDSDFCLRATAAGRRNYVTLDVELYHLERQSQARIGDSQWRANLTLYNCWLHDKRWAAQIGKIQR